MSNKKIHDVSYGPGNMVISGMLQGSVMGPLLFLVYVNDIWRNIDSCIRFFADDCVIYRKIVNKNDIERLHKDLDTVGEWAVENGMKINPGKSKAVRFMRAQVKNSLGYSLGDQKILEVSSCKYLGIILQSDLNWVDEVNCTAQKAWKAFHFVTCVLKKGNRNTNVHPTCHWYVLFLHMGLHAGIRADICVRPSAEESCSIYKSYEGF